MEQVIFAGYYDALHTTNTEYNKLVGGYFWRTSEFEAKTVVSTAGTIKNLRVNLSFTPGAGKHYDFTLMLNGSPTALTLEIADGATTGNNATVVAVVAGDTVSLRSAPTNTPSAPRARWTSVFVGDIANESLILGGTNAFTLQPGSTEYAQVMGGATNPTPTEDDFRQVCPTAGVIKNLYVVLDNDPGTAPDAYRFTLRLNGATVGESSIVTITADDTTGNDTAHNLVVAAGDILTMMIEPLISPSYSPKAQWGMTFVADTDGESIILGGTHNDLHTGDTEAIQLQSSEVYVWGSIHQARYQIGQACALKKLHLLLSAAPGAGKKYTFTVRIAIADSNVVVEIADAATTGNSGGLTDTVSDDDYVTLGVVPTGTPDVADAYWGLVSTPTPPVVAPTVTTQAATNVGTTTATGNGNITDTGGENSTKRGIAYDTTSRGDPGSLSPAASDYTNFEEETGSFGTGAFTRSLTGLSSGTTIYARAYAFNSAGYNWGGEVSFKTDFAQVVGGGAIAIAGALGLLTKISVGAGSMAITGALVAVLKFFQNVGAGSIAIAGSLTTALKFFQVVGAGSIAISGALGLLIKLSVGAGSIAIAGALSRVIKLAVGAGSVAISGSIGHKIKIAVGAGAIAIAGVAVFTFNRILGIKSTLSQDLTIVSTLSTGLTIKSTLKGA